MNAFMLLLLFFAILFSIMFPNYYGTFMNNQQIKLLQKSIDNMNHSIKIVLMNNDSCCVKEYDGDILKSLNGTLIIENPCKTKI